MLRRSEFLNFVKGSFRKGTVRYKVDAKEFNMLYELRVK